MLLRIMSTNGKFEQTAEFLVETTAEAQQIVEAYARGNGLTRVKLVDGEDDGARFTATTPNGRSGRNIAFLDY